MTFRLEYGTMIQFFRSASWSFEEMLLRWFSAVKEFSPVYREGRFCVLIGDGVKQARKDRRMISSLLLRVGCLEISVQASAPIMMNRSNGAYDTA